MAFYGDSDAQETQEWQDAFDSVLQHMGTERAAFLLKNFTNKQLLSMFQFNVSIHLT